MAFENAYEFLKTKGMGNRVMQFSVSSATVELAAQAIGCKPEKIAKSLTFMGTDGPVMVVCAGDAKVTNAKFKAFFGIKAKMLSFEEVSDLIGHDVGGVCPFGIKPGVKVFLDESLKRFEFIYPACGNSASAVKLTPDELYDLANSSSWVDVCSLMENNNG